jgi:hypothetical protein
MQPKPDVVFFGGTFLTIKCVTIMKLNLYYMTMGECHSSRGKTPITPSPLGAATGQIMLMETLRN